MKRKLTLACLYLLLPLLGIAQVPVNWDKYPDYPLLTPEDSTLMQSYVIQKNLRSRGTKTAQRPDHANSAELKFFPPVIGQVSGSCGASSGVGYQFTHEINAYRNLDGTSPANHYPTHFTYLFTFGNSNPVQLMQHVGIPTAEVYGGQTYSSVFGNFEWDDYDFGWMQGYDRWYSAMYNRITDMVRFPSNVGTEAGREAVKNWIWNHNGDPDFHGGGICGIGVASGGDWQRIPKTKANDAAGVTGMYFVNRWGKQVDHALTIVGYDDRIEFDLDGNGIAGEAEKDELGAWIIVNSWGNEWCNEGFIYCPYAYGGSTFKEISPNKYVFGGYWWEPSVLKVRKNYRPLRTIKLKMDYSRRSELFLSIGVSSDIHADEPERTQPMEHFKWAGDGRNGDSIPAPEIPMLGRWADGKLHHEPMEFGYDLTDLTEGMDRNMPLKYFFTVDTRPWAEGKGHIYSASVIDYEYNRKGVETPFNLGTGPVEIKNKGEKTIISVVVYGESFYAAQNLSLQGQQLSWSEPIPSCHTLEGYQVFADGQQLGSTAKDELCYQIPEGCAADRYSVKAVYENEVMSEEVSINAPVMNEEKNRCVNFQNSGFTIPHVFESKHNEATIEFWMKPNSVLDWNQAAGPGWDMNFMWHANANGAFTVGWDFKDRIFSSEGKLVKDKWIHVAIVVDHNAMHLYLDGRKAGSITSDKHTGIGGFGDLAVGRESNLDARIEEMRIWNYARTETQISENMHYQFAGNVLPYGLVSYFKGDTIQSGKEVYYRDCVGGNHAVFKNNRFKRTMSILRLYDPSGKQNIDIVEPQEELFVGMPVKLQTKYTDGISNILWNVAEANIRDLKVQHPSLIFQQPGDYQVIVEGSNADQSIIVKDTCILKVQDMTEPDASFTILTDKISAGVPVSFIANKTILGYQYQWEMKGADVEEAHTMNAAAVYQNVGDYTVTLTVSAPDGKRSSTSQTVSVVEVPPVADFDVAPAVIVKDEVTFLKDRSKYRPTEWTWTLRGANDDIIINGQQTSLVPTQPGVYDVTLKVANGVGTDEKTRERGLIICNADSKNGLVFSGNSQQVVLKNSPFQRNTQSFTIEWWMKPANLTTYSLGIGEKDETFLVKTRGNGAMTFSMRSHTVESPSGYVIANQWHHYALAVHRGNVSFYRDGMLIDTQSTGTYVMPVLEQFAIGHPDMPMSGQMDEFRIWCSTLSEKDIRTFANEPIADVAAAEREHQLVVYYDFNQNGGDVKDRTSHQNDGVRLHFGPDGDAWGQSHGVFCLDFNPENQKQDITSTYLKNYKLSFAYDNNKVVNPTLPYRFKAIKDWTIENVPVTESGITGGACVDLNNKANMSFETGWNGSPNLTDHKVYQTITLPEGSYTFTAVYSREGSGDNYLVVAEGKGLPNTSAVADSALAFTPMLPKGRTDANSLHFILTKETEVSVGLIVNMTGTCCTGFDHFKLERGRFAILEADGANGYDKEVDESKYATLYLPYPTTIPEGVTAYWAKEIKGNEIALEPIDDGIVPAKTGVVIEAEPGTYHFAPSTQSSTTTSMLTGTLVDKAKDENSRYYTLNNADALGFYPFTGETLTANTAFLLRENTDTNEAYLVKKVAVNIEDMFEIPMTDSTIYDLTGRKVTHPTKGLYIRNGKKIYIK